jgi:hypothetical protein
MKNLFCKVDFVFLCKFIYVPRYKTSDKDSWRHCNAESPSLWEFLMQLR